MSDTAEANFAITEVQLKYPEPGGAEKGLVAYASFKLSVGEGWFEVYVKSLKLMHAKKPGEYFFQMPHEPRRAKCQHCRARNADHVPYCNWCGKALNPANKEGWFYEVVVPANVQTRAAILKALVEEHERQQAVATK